VSFQDLASIVAVQPLIHLAFKEAGVESNTASIRDTILHTLPLCLYNYDYKHGEWTSDSLFSLEESEEQLKCLHMWADFLYNYYCGSFTTMLLMFLRVYSEYIVFCCNSFFCVWVSITHIVSARLPKLRSEYFTENGAQLQPT